MADLTLASVLNDIRVALAAVREQAGATQISLLGPSFGGGICAYYASGRVRASYRHLNTEAPRLLDQLGLHPGHSFDATAVAALCGVDPVEVRPPLDRLVRAHPLRRAGHGRFAQHDLLRVFTRELSASLADTDRQEALRRLLDHYLNATAAAVEAPQPPSETPTSDRTWDGDNRGSGSARENPRSPNRGTPRWAKGAEYPGRHEPLVGQELFDRVQVRIESTGVSGERRITHDQYLKGTVWCDRCRERGVKRRLIVNRVAGKGDIEYFYYFCRGRQDASCTLPYIPIYVLEEEIARFWGDARPVGELHPAGA